MSEYVPVMNEELLAGFLDEAPEYLTILDEGLLAFESKGAADGVDVDNPDDKARMNEMFRAAHSFKGLGAAMGFDNIRDLTHVMETLFDQIRMGKRPFTSETIQTLFGVFDRLRELIKELTEPAATPVTIDDVLVQLNAILATSPVLVSAPTPAIIAEPVSEEAAVALPDAVVADAQASVASTTSESAVTGGVLDNKELAKLFVDTTLETLDELNQTLLKLEKDPNDTGAINDVFRCAHNIKGATGAAGCTALYHLTHEMETVLDLVRNKRLQLEEGLSTAIFGVVDRIRADVMLIHDGQIDQLSSEGTQGVFEAWLPKLHAAPAAARVVTPVGVDATDDSETGDDADLRVAVTFPKDFPEAEIQAYLIYNKLKEHGRIDTTDPDVDALDGTTSLERIVYHLHTSVEPAALQQMVLAYGVQSVAVEAADGRALVAAQGKVVSDKSAAPSSDSTAIAETPAPVIAAKAAAASPAPTTIENKPAAAPRPAASKEGDAAAKAAPPAKVAETIRVDLERLDQLMNLGGELVINKARLAQIQGRFDPLFQGQNLGYVVDDATEHLTRLRDGIARLAGESRDRAVVSELTDAVHSLSRDFDSVRGLIHRVHDTRGAMVDFAEAMHSLGRVSEGIQKRIMDTRMVSIGPLFQRFKRVVRDIAKSTSKQVELVLHGEATELDKRMIDELGDPLTHMVRNSVDHGIELPDDRVKAGKPAMAQVVLDAYHRGRHICIEVRDDGRGVNTERVRAKILERELATPAEVDRMSDRDIVQYIFKPGFSTAEQVSDLSGRGMGMDIVLTKIESLNGTVEVESVPGKGTTVTIKLPLTMAIITAMLARIGKSVYALPLEVVAEIITVPQSAISHVQRRRVVRVRDHVIPIVLFEQIFTSRWSELETVSKNDRDITLMILHQQSDRVGLVVDELIGQEDVVIKNIAENYRNVTGVAGASIMGDGSVSLILDVVSMFSMLASRSEEEFQAAWQDAAPCSTIEVAPVDIEVDAEPEVAAEEPSEEIAHAVC